MQEKSVASAGPETQEKKETKTQEASVTQDNSVVAAAAADLPPAKPSTRLSTFAQSVGASDGQLTAAKGPGPKTGSATGEVAVSADGVQARVGAVTKANTTQVGVNFTGSGHSSVQDGVRKTDVSVGKGITFELAQADRSARDGERRRKYGAEFGVGVQREYGYGAVKTPTGEVVADRFVDGKGIEVRAGADIGRIGASGSVAADRRVSAIGMRGADGQAVSKDTLVERSRVLSKRTAGANTDAQVDGFLATLSTMRSGDRVTVDQGSSASLDVKVGVIAGGVGVGGASKSRTVRTVEKGEDGKVRVTIATYDAQSGKITGSVGPATADVTKTTGQRNVQSVEFDTKTPEGRRDLVINQFTGLLPGQAKRLGVTDVASAKKFLAAGGMAAVADGRWKTPDGSREGVRERNAQALKDPASVPGLTRSSQEAIGKVQASARVLGMNIFSSSHTSSSKREQVRGPDGQLIDRTVHTTEARSSLLWLDEEGEKSSLSLDSRGKLEGWYSTDRADPDTLKIAGQKPSDALAAAADDPVVRMRVEADVKKLAEVLRRQAEQAKAAGTAQPNVVDGSVMVELRDRSGLQLPRGGQAVLDAAAAKANLSTRAMKREVARQLKASGGDLTKLSDDALKVYAATSTSMGGKHGLRVLSQLATLPPDRAQPAIEAALRGLGAAGVKNLAEWAKKNPELAKVVKVEQKMLAGSSDANMITTSDSAEKREEAGKALLTKLGAIKKDSERAAFLDALDKTAGGFDPKGGGLGRMLDKMTPTQAADLIRTNGKHPLVAAYLQKNPGAAIPPHIPFEQRAAWAEKNLKGALGKDADIGAIVAASANHFTKGISRGTVERFAQLNGVDAKDKATLFKGQSAEQTQDMLRWLEADKGRNFDRLAVVAKQMGVTPVELAKRVFTEQDPVLREYLSKEMSMAGGDPTRSQRDWMAAESAKQVILDRTGAKRISRRTNARGTEDDSQYRQRLWRNRSGSMATTGDFFRARRAGKA